MTRVCDIAAFLEEKVPTALKMDYDNVGLLCGFPDREVSRVLVALDITLETIREAADIGAELFVSHHPVIFSPLYTVREDDPTGRRVIELLHNGISAICLHTNLDRHEVGVNTALARAIGAEVETMLDMGCICRLEEPMELGDFLAATGKALGAEDIRYLDTTGTVQRLAVCGGAGGDMVYEAVKYDCDTVLTGEIKHHQWIDGKELGLNLIDAGHYPTENVVVPVLCDMLRSAFPDIEICASAVQRPLTTGFGLCY